MLLRTASALMIAVVCCGIAVAADLPVPPKGHPKARPVQPVAPSVPAPPIPTQTPAIQAPAPQPALPAPKQDAPAQQTPSQSAPQQQPAAPQRLQSPETPADQNKPAPIPVPDDDKRLNDLQPPALPAPTEGESWWQKVVRSAPNCRTFSDGCRTCDTTFTCSSLPIACQPKEFVCIDPVSPQTPK